MDVKIQHMMTRSIPGILLIMAAMGLIPACSGRLPEVNSPDGSIRVVLENAGHLTYRVQYRGGEIIAPSGLGLRFRDHESLDRGLTITGRHLRSHDSQWERVWGKDRVVRDHYNELELNLANKENGQKMDLIVRVYDDGVAIRYHLPEQENIADFELTSDETEFVFRDNHRVWAAHYGSFKSHQESEFDEMRLDDPRMKEITGMPLLVETGDSAWVAITEANLTDWAGMYVRLEGDSPCALETVLAPYPDDPELLVRSRTPRNSPWRLIMIGESPGDFIESDIIANLNEPNALDDVSWIRPGKSAWDWWWCNRYGPDVNFELGSNTETMKYFIDLAAEMGWQYQLVDWYWYDPPHLEGGFEPDLSRDITTMNPDIDIPELVRYGAEKGVRILLWLDWNHADRQMDQAFPLYEKWGVAGVKVDFMQRDDQYVVNFYHRLVKKAAEHHLVVDFHGAYKPTGVSRTYPNLLTREGIMGNEYTKWSRRITPEHKVTIPFTRGMLGEMDFTPGAFVNVRPDQFKVESEAPCPMVMGTRCNELAMLVVYESALQVLCDAPYNYRHSPAGTDFLRIVPTTWDETRVINAAVGDYITTARRSGDDWFIGSMTDANARQLAIPLDFLEEGTYVATIWQDAGDADMHPTNLDKLEMEVDRSAVLQANLAPGGGQVVCLRRGK
jgi:alpha-glucosidase